MKRLLNSLLAVILVGIMAWSYARAAVVSHDTKPRPLYYDQWEPTNVSIDSLTKLVRELNQGQFPNPLKIPAGSAIRIPNPNGRYLDVVRRVVSPSYNVHLEQMDTVRFDIVIARTYVSRGDGHDCFWWSSRDYLISNQAKPRTTINPAPIPAPILVPFPDPSRNQFSWWFILATLMVPGILGLAGWGYHNYLNSPERYPPVRKGGLKNLNAQEALNALASVHQYRDIFQAPQGIRATQANWGQLIRTSLSKPKKLALWMRINDGTTTNVKVREGQPVLRVKFSDDSIRYFLAGCANLAYFTNEMALPEGWAFAKNPMTGSGYSVPNTTLAQSSPQSASAVTEPSAPPAPTVTEPTPVQTPNAPFKEPLDLHKILEDPRVTYLHFKQGDVEIKIDMKGTPAEKETKPK